MELQLPWVSLGTAPNTVREYLSDHYAAMVYRRMRVHGKTSQVAGRVAMTLRQRMRTGKFVVPPIGVHDERQKLTGKCVYCNGPGTSVDHLIPRLAGGPDSADNLVTACKSCNSSKGGRDLYDWASRQEFFPLGVTRRYLVLAWR